MSREFVQTQIKADRVQRNGSVLNKPGQKLQPGDVLSGYFEERPAPNLTPISFPLDVLFEDQDILVLNKPQDMVVHPAIGYSGPTLVHYLLHYFKEESQFRDTSDSRPGIVHRLDRGTSGVLLIAKNRPSLESLSAQFKNREVKKEYESVVWGRMNLSGKFQSHIGRDERERKKMSSNTQKGREAVTDWKTVTLFPHFTHVALFPHTGRTHQLRVHLSEGGFPIVGDPLYSKRSSSRKRQSVSRVLQETIETLQHPFLHARRLSFFHPKTRKEVSCEADPPKEFEGFLKLLNTEDKE